MVAAAYGLTPEQFLSYTPRQLQMVLETLRIRVHNDRALQLKMHNFKADFIDVEAEKMMKSIKRQHVQKDEKKIRDKMEAEMRSKSDGR